MASEFEKWCRKEGYGIVPSAWDSDYLNGKCEGRKEGALWALKWIQSKLLPNECPELNKEISELENNNGK